MDMKIEKQIRRAVLKAEKGLNINLNTIGVDGFGSPDHKAKKFDTKHFSITVLTNIPETHYEGGSVIYEVVSKSDNRMFKATHYFPNKSFNNVYSWWVRELKESEGE